MIFLANAQQSSTETTYKCLGDQCLADKAIDEDISTNSYTTDDPLPWWKAELSKITRIENIILYLSDYNYNQGHYTGFKVETSITEDAWVVCKGPYDVQKPIRPHIITCNKPTIAKYVRLSREIDVVGYLALREVNVNGVSLGKSLFFFIFHF